MTPIDKEGVAARIAEGATVVEALPASYYEQGHLPGAINLPHDAVDELAAEVLPDLDATVVVYCSNLECRNSTIAAERLTALGYRNVFDYQAGKEDWIAGGMPVEKSEVTR